ncbi:MAG: CpsD/CapB family tyrosine-protein kinase [Clostridia bacterium]|nr:CpsD/CapB family tyrosine-protein kinase [Clostridia bacterium]
MAYLEIGFLPKLEFSCNEALNTLATNLSYCGDDVKTILITSRYAYEGKSFMGMNLMRTLTTLGKRVVLVDADLRRSKIMSQHQIHFTSEQHFGLAHYLAGMCEMEDVVYQTNITGAYLVPIGREVSSSLQLLSSNRMPPLMQTLRENFDVVLIDAPPAGVIVDAVELAKYCDGALVVVSYNRGRRKDITEVVNAIRKTGCPVLGSVLNNVDFRSFTSRNHYYKSERYASYYKRGYTAYDVQKHAKK